MYDYAEFCPIAKASQILCERWTLLIIREMLMGATRFNEFRRYLPRISPSLLNVRLRALEEQGVLMRVRSPGQRGYEYQLTAAGRELESVIMSLGAWALRWQYESMAESEIRTDALIRDLAQCIDVAALPRRRTVLRLHLSDVDDRNRWDIEIDGGRTEICDEGRALEVDIWMTGDRKVLNDVVLGVVSLDRAIVEGRLKVSGEAPLLKALPRWFGISPFAGLERAGAGTR